MALDGERGRALALKKRILNYQIPKPPPVLHIFAIKHFAASLYRRRNDKRVVPRNLPGCL